MKNLFVGLFFIFVNLRALDIVIYENPYSYHSPATLKAIEENGKNLIEIKKYEKNCNIQCMLSESLYQSYLYYIESKGKEIKLDIYEIQSGKRIYTIKENLSGDSFGNIVLKGNTLVRLFYYKVIDIFQAIDENDEKMLKYFLHGNKILKKRNGLLMNPLNYALYKKKYNLVKYLLKDSSQVYKEDLNKITPLHRIAEWGNFELFKDYYFSFLKDLKDNNGNNFLHYALMSGNVKLINFLLKNGFSFRDKNNYNKNCLQFLAQAGNLELFKKFYEKYPEQLLNITKIEQNILHFAVQSGNLELFKYISEELKNKNFDIKENSFDKLHRNYLFYSVKANKEGYIKNILDLGFKIENDYQGNNLLHYAVLNEKIISIRDLIGLNVDIKKENNFKQTPLLLAFRYLNLENVKEMITDLDFTDLRDINGLSPLHYSVLGNKFRTLNYLIENNIDMNIKSKFGENALFFAILSRSESLFLYLYYRGVNPELKTVKGNNLLHIAVQEKNPWFFNFLIKHNKKLYTKNEKGEYPLDVAIKEGNLNSVKAVYKKLPLEFYRPDENNYRAMEKVIISGNREIFDFLLKENIRVDIPDNEGECALDIAFRVKNEYMISSLRRIGADFCKKN